MFYKPKYCCNCGEKIERSAPSITDSRRFCDVCKHDFVLHRSLPLVFVLLMAIFGIFGIGSYWRNSTKTPVSATRQIAVNSSNTGKNPVNNASAIGSNLSVQPASNTGNVQTSAASTPILTTKPPAKQTATAPVAPVEAVYFCGAPTKKGTPCSRRVRGGGRCWQHKGLEAMLAAEKLLVSR